MSGTDPDEEVSDDGREYGHAGTTETCAEPRLVVGTGHREERREGMTEPAGEDGDPSRVNRMTEASRGVMQDEDASHHGMA